MAGLIACRLAAASTEIETAGFCASVVDAVRTPKTIAATCDFRVRFIDSILLDWACDLRSAVLLMTSKAEPAVRTIHDDVIDVHFTARVAGVAICLPNGPVPVTCRQ